MIIPFKKAFGEPIITKHIGPNNKLPIAVYRKTVHKNGFYPVYRIVRGGKIKIYKNKSFKELIGILKKMGY